MLKKIQRGVLLALMLVAMVTSSVSAAPWWESIPQEPNATNENSSGSLRRTTAGIIQLNRNGNWGNTNPVINVNNLAGNDYYVLNCEEFRIMSGSLGDTDRGIRKDNNGTSLWINNGWTNTAPPSNASVAIGGVSGTWVKLANCGSGSAPGFNVAFDCDGANDCPSEITGTTSIADAPTAPTKDGFTFLHWSKTIGGDPVSFPLTITEATTLHSVWQDNSIQYYNVTLELNGGTGPSNFSIRQDSPQLTAAPTAPTKTKAEFLYWSFNQGGTEIGFPATLDKDTTLYAIYRDFISVTFDLDGGTGGPDNIEDAQSPLAEPAEKPTKDKHVFEYWSLTKDGIEAVTFPYSFSENITLYTVWHRTGNSCDDYRDYEDYKDIPTHIKNGEIMTRNSHIFEKQGGEIYSWYNGTLVPETAINSTHWKYIGDCVSYQKTPTINDFTFDITSMESDYDGTNKTLEVTSSKSGMGAITVSYKKDGQESVTPKDAGEYTAYVSVVEGSIYAATESPIELGTFTIAKATITVTWNVEDNYNYTYNGLDQVPEITNIDGLVNGENEEVLNLQVTGGATNASQDGYTARVTIENDNYSLDGLTESLNFTISPAPITLAWETELTYNGQEQTPTASVSSGLVNDEEESDLGLVISGSSKNASETAYPANATITNTNYTLANAEQDFTIVKYPADVVWSDASELLWTGEPQAPTATIVGLGEDGDIELIVNGEQTNVGVNYLATATLPETEVAANYTLEEGTSTTYFSIYVVAADPTADDFDYSDPMFTYNGTEQSVNALITVPDNMSENLNITYRNEDTMEEGVSPINAGTYTVLVQPEANDFFNQPETPIVIGTLTITPATIEVTWSEINEFIYNGQEQAPAIDVVGGLKGEDTREMLNLLIEGSAIDASDNLTAHATIANDNYSLDGLNDSKDFAIKPASITLDWINFDGLTYNGSVQNLSVIVTGLVNGEEESVLNLSLVFGDEVVVKDAAEYTATATIESNNYTLLEPTTYQFTIAKYEATVAWDNTTFEWTGIAQKPTATIVGLGEDGEIELVVSGAQRDAGNHTATATLPEEFAANYTLTNTTTSFTINALPAGGNTCDDIDVWKKAGGAGAGGAYLVGDIVKYEDSMYECLVSHDQNANTYTPTGTPWSASYWKLRTDIVCEETGATTFNVSFNFDGGTAEGLDAFEAVEGVEVPAPETTPTKDRAKFLHWSFTQGGDAIDFPFELEGDVTLYAVWEEDVKYTVSFNLDGGDEDANFANIVEYANEDVSIPTETPTKTNYTFLHWAFEQNGEEAIGESFTLTQDTTIWAVWQENAKFTVSFDLDEGIGEFDEFKEYVNSEIQEPETKPTRENFTFQFWAFAKNGEEVTFPFTLTQDTTLYATWTENEKFTVAFDLDGGTGEFDGLEEYVNTEIQEPELEPTKDGFTFLHWSFAKDSAAIDFPFALDQNRTLWAVWQEDAIVKGEITSEHFTYADNTELEYTGEEHDIFALIEAATGIHENWNIKFNGEVSAPKNAGSYVITVQPEESDLFLTPESPITIGTVIVTPVNAEVVWSTELTFEWTGLPQAPTATINGVGNDGEIELVVSGAQRNEGNHTATAVLPEESEVNYTLVGATKNFEITKPLPDGNTCDGIVKYSANALPFDGGTTVQHDGSLYTSTIQITHPSHVPGSSQYWTKIGECEPIYATPLNISFELDGGINGPDGFDAAKNVKVPAPETTPTRDGFEFKHWSFAKDSAAITFPFTLTENTTLWAVWKVAGLEQFTVSFELDGGEGDYAAFVEDEGTNILAPQGEPEKDGYTFLYWSFEQEGEATVFPFELIQDTTLWAVWEEGVKQFTVSFKLSGAENGPADYQADKNTVINEPTEIPTKDGEVTFEHWSFEPNGTAISFPFTLTQNVDIYAVFNYGGREGDGSTTCGGIRQWETGDFNPALFAGDKIVYNNTIYIVTAQGPIWWAANPSSSSFEKQGECELLVYADERDFSYDDQVVVYNAEERIVDDFITVADGISENLNIVYFDADDSAVTPKDAGVYKVTVQPENNGKFLKPIEPIVLGTLTIEKAPLTVNFTAISKVYNGEEQEPDFEVAGIQGEDANLFDVYPNKEVINAADDYSFEVSLKTSVPSSNYQLFEESNKVDFWTTNFAITPIELIVNTDDLELSAEYDATNKLDYLEEMYEELQVTINELGNLVFVNSDDIVEGENPSEGIALDISGITEAINAGDYTIAVKLTDQPNYTIKDGGIVFTITPKVIDAVWGATEFTYSGEEQKPTATFDEDEVEGSDVIALTVSGEETDAGEYTAIAAFDNTNYAVSEETATQDFVINPAEITVGWSDVVEFIYDGTEHAPDMWYVSGLVNGELEDILGLEVSGKEANAGEHTATAVVSNTNYVVSEETATKEFTIKAIELDVVWGDVVIFEYNGYKQAPEVSLAEGEDAKIIGEDIVNVVVIDSMKNVGVYSATASFDNTNYVVSDATKELEDGFEITPIEAGEITWGELELPWTGEPQAPRATMEGVGLDGTIELVVGEKQTDIGGPYPVTAALPDSLELNYSGFDLQDTDKEFNIMKRTVAVIWSDEELVYNREAQAPAASVEGNVVELIISGQETNAGEGYIARAEMSSEDSLTTILTNSEKVFSISKKSLEVFWYQTTKGYTGEALQPLAMVENDEIELTVVWGDEDAIEMGDYENHFWVIFADEDDELNYILTNDTLAVFTIDDGTPIAKAPKSDNNCGIKFVSGNIVCDNAVMAIVLPNNERTAEVKVAIYDMTGNVVFDSQTRNTEVSWNLKNSTGRVVANGAYLVVAEAKDMKGKSYNYSAKLGVKK